MENYTAAVILKMLYEVNSLQCILEIYRNLYINRNVKDVFKIKFQSKSHDNMKINYRVRDSVFETRQK